MQLNAVQPTGTRSALPQSLPVCSQQCSRAKQRELPGLTCDRAALRKVLSSSELVAGSLDSTCGKYASPKGVDRLLEYLLKNAFFAQVLCRG